MIELFGSAGRDAIARLGTQRTLYAFDYDGTLSPIVARPEDAGAAPTTVALLTRLGARVPTLLLTGRRRGRPAAVASLSIPTHLVGNHGAEGMPAVLTDGQALAASRDIVTRWLSQWPSDGMPGSDPAIQVEAKAYSLSVHYRAAADHDAARKTIEGVLARLDPQPRLIDGKCVFNVLPASAPDKGQALAALVAFERCTAAFFIGDDVTDECAFENAPESWVTVRIGRSDRSAARYFIEDQRDIDRCPRAVDLGRRSGVDRDAAGLISMGERVPGKAGD